MILKELSHTKRLAQQCINLLPQGTLLVLSGELGAGKTTFTQQLALCLGSTAHVSSPTYTLIHEYPTPQGTLVHMDAYRLLPQTKQQPAADMALSPDTATTIIQAGLDDYIDYARLVVVEWGAVLLPHYPEAYNLTLHLQKDGSRHAELSRASSLIDLKNSFNQTK